MWPQRKLFLFLVKFQGSHKAFYCIFIKAWKLLGTCATGMYRSSRRICNSRVDKTLRQLKSCIFKSHCFQCVVGEVKKFERSVKVCNCRRKQSCASGICSSLTYSSGFSKGSSSSIIRKSEPLVVTFFLSSSCNVMLFLWNLSYRVHTLVVKNYFCFHLCSKQGVKFFLVQESANHSVKSVLKEI